MAKKEITTLSSAAERALAAEQLRAAQNEFNNSIKQLPQGTPISEWTKIGENIAQRYDYVDFGFFQPEQTGGGLQVNVSPGEFFVKGYGTNSDFETYKSPVLTSRDDAYIAPSSSIPSSSLSNTGNNLRGDLNGGSASDAPSLSGSKTTPAPASGTNANASTYSSTATDGTSGPNPANTTPVTQNGDATSVAADPAAGEAGSRGDRLPGDSTGSAAAGRDDDASNDGGTGAGSNTGNSTGDSQDGSGGGTNNSGVSVGQAGQGSQLSDPGKRGTPQNKRILQRPNPLHNYVNWTYQVGWYMLDIPAFNSFVQTGSDSSALRKKPLMRSGGFAKKGSGLEFDLSLVSLRLGNVIGNNSTSPGSNIYEIEMQVMEPYGVSLIQQLKQQAGDNDDPFNIPYLLEIKWLGYDDRGMPVNNIPDSGPKLIPVKIINITFEIDSAGTVYTITMIPYAQSAIDRIDGILRQDIQLYGDSLQALLKEGSDSLKEFLNKKAKDDVKNNDAEFADEYDFEIISFDSGTRTRNNKLATAPVTFPQQGGSGTVQSRRGTPSEYDGTKANDPNKQYFSFKGGTTIVAAVLAMAKNSKYFQDNVPSVPNGDKEKPLELIKVVPVITDIGKYDNVRRTYQKKITYKIMSYFDYARLYPYGGQAGVEKRGFVKEYNWIFTGKNDDIFDLKLNFDLMYYKVMTKAPAEKGALNTVAITERPPDTKNTIKVSDSIYSPQNRTGAGDPNNKGFKPQSVNDAFDYALNSPRKADLVTLDLSIIGDPDWITQDRSVRPKGNDINANNSGYVDNDYKMGIAVDVDSVYVKFQFRTPRDYSDETGLMNLTVDQTLLSGVYKVVTVDSMFQEGRFTQQLGLVRAEGQLENKPENSAKTSDARESSGSSSSSIAEARRQDRLSVPGYLSPVVKQGPAERDRSSSLGDPVAQALYNTSGRPNQATPTNPNDAAIQNYYGYTDDGGR